MQQITIQELYRNWAFYNPHYNFWVENQEIKSVHATADYKYYAVYTYDDKRILVLNDDLIEAVPKAPQFTELQDVSDLDATLPIIPAETAKRDHDRIVQLESENAKMRGLLNELCTRAPSQPAKYHIDNEVRDYHDVLRELGFAAAFILKELGQ